MDAKQHIHDGIRRKKNITIRIYNPMQNLQPWQYSGILNEEESQPLPSPLEFIRMCGVSSANPESIRAMESLILEKLCMHINTRKKTKLLNETLKILKNGTF